MIKGLLYIVALTTVVVVSWIIFSVYHSYTTSTITQDTSIGITPIPAKFDTQTLDKLKEKNQVEVDLSKDRVNISITPGETKITPATGSAGSASDAGQITNL